MTLPRTIIPNLWAATDPDAIITWWGTESDDRFNLTSVYGRIYRDPQPDGTSNSRPYQVNAWGDDGDDHIKGGDAQDYIAGMGGRDVLQGGKGDDVLRGDNGGDIMRGGDGDDHLFHFRGNDLAQGGQGSDSFYVRFFASNENQRAAFVTIKDFDVDEDTIVFKNVKPGQIEATELENGWMFSKGGDDLAFVRGGSFDLDDLVDAFEFTSLTLDQITEDALL